MVMTSTPGMGESKMEKELGGSSGEPRVEMEEEKKKKKTSKNQRLERLLKMKNG